MNINSLLHKGSSVLKERRIRTYKIDSELILSEIIKKELEIRKNEKVEADKRADSFDKTDLD